MHNPDFLLDGKVFDNSFAFDDYPMTIIKDPKKLVKTASSKNQYEFLKQIKPEKGRTKLLALFLGAGEYYSSNRNGDWFGEKDLINNYHTFKDDGHVYKHHRNKDPNKKFGDVEYVFYNHAMKRVEGIMSLIDELCGDELGKIERGEDIPVSMAAKLPYDVCSICANKARKVSDYCTHLKNQMNQILSDGRKVNARNPNPRFFDISIVFRPADETAWVFEKVAGYDPTPERSFFSYYSLDNLKNNRAMFEKRSAINKLAEIEKQIQGIFAGKIEDSGAVKASIRSMADKEPIPESKMNELKGQDIENVLPELTKNKVMLTLKEFLKMLGKDDMFGKVVKIMPGSFSRMADEDCCGVCDDVDNFMLGHGFSESPLHIGKKILQGIPSSRGGARVSITIVKKASEGVSFLGIYPEDHYNIVKKSNENSNKGLANNLCKLYNLYKIGYLLKNDDKKTALQTVSNNFFA